MTPTGSRPLPPKGARGPSVFLRMQLRHQPVGAGGNAAPVFKPSARKAQRNLCGVELTVIHAGGAPGADLARAAGEELLGCGPDIDQILAVVWRTGAKRHDGKPVRAGRG